MTNLQQHRSGRSEKYSRQRSSQSITVGTNAVSGVSAAAMTSAWVSVSDKRQPFDDSPLADLEERKVIFAVLDSFRQYRKNCHYNTTHRRRQNLYALPRKTWSVLAASPINLLNTLNLVDDAIDQNADIADAILSLGIQTFALPENPDSTSEYNWFGTAKPNDMVKAHSTIRQFYRDWSAEGFETEVKPILDLTIAALEGAGLYPSPQCSPTILLPGAGLGRLLFELCLAGYQVEGNEISYHQLLASNFILNTTQRAQQYTLYPFVTTFTNQLSRQNQLQKVLVPDIHPGIAISERSRSAIRGEAILGEMNMTAGDFLTSYSSSDSKESFDAVLTAYFIDTAPNFMRYIETMRHCLKTGGVWINVGPLLWHFDDRRAEPDSDRVEPNLPADGIDMKDDGIGEPGSFELTDEEVLLLVQQVGFEIIKHEHLPDTRGGYIQDPNSMMRSSYRCSHWVAKKL